MYGKYINGKVRDIRSEDVWNMVVVRWMGRYVQLHFGMLRSHVNVFGLVFRPKTLKCSLYIAHVVQNSWQPLCDQSHSGKYTEDMGSDGNVIV